jgi:hypothetical protein
MEPKILTLDYAHAVPPVVPWYAFQLTAILTAIIKTARKIPEGFSPFALHSSRLTLLALPEWIGVQ